MIIHDTLTIHEVNVGRNSPHRFRLALVRVDGDRASAPIHGSGVDRGLQGFGDTQITRTLQQLLAAGRTPHRADAVERAAGYGTTKRGGRLSWRKRRAKPRSSKEAIVSQSRQLA